MIKNFTYQCRNCFRVYYAAIDIDDDDRVESIRPNPMKAYVKRLPNIDDPQMMVLCSCLLGTKWQMLSPKDKETLEKEKKARVAIKADWPDDNLL